MDASDQLHFVEKLIQTLLLTLEQERNGMDNFVRVVGNFVDTLSNDLALPFSQPMAQFFRGLTQRMCSRWTSLWQIVIFPPFSPVPIRP